MKQDKTEIVFILDRSGSMALLADDTIDGYNSFIEEQKSLRGDSRLTTVLFNHEYSLLHDSIDLNKVKPIANKDYVPAGTTALLDAVGFTINFINDRITHTSKEDKPNKVIFVITTDGNENASREFSKHRIKTMITHQTDEHGWKFLFLGANIDAITVAESYGIAGGQSCNYTASAAGTDSMYKSVSNTVSSYRSTGEINKDWNSAIQ